MKVRWTRRAGVTWKVLFSLCLLDLLDHLLLASLSLPHTTNALQNRIHRENIPHIATSFSQRSSPTLFCMPFIHVAWLPKACRTPQTRKEVASAIIRAVCSVEAAQITPDKVVVRFSEAVDGFPLPPGHTHENVDIVAKNSCE